MDREKMGRHVEVNMSAIGRGWARGANAKVWRKEGHGNPVLEL